MKKNNLLTLFLMLIGTSLFAQRSFFQAVQPGEVPQVREASKQVKNKGLFRLNEQAMRIYLRAARLEFRNNGITLPLEIPFPDGRTETFNMVESPILSPAVAAQNPDIKTYTGNGTKDKKSIIRISFTANGFSAIILNVGGDAVYFEPYSKQQPGIYFNYFGKDAISPGSRALKGRCGILDLPDGQKAVARAGSNNQLQRNSGGILRTFRIAVAANGEFTAQNGGTQASSFATVVNYVNDLTAVYRNELSVSFTLISGTSIIYTNATTDPYDNSNQDAMLNQNQTNLDAVIGSGNYDIGHVWGTELGSGGGVAVRESVCDAAIKGKGVSGEGDGSYAQIFYDQLFFHEVGHQFGMTHSYNSSNAPVCTSRFAATSVEPGSGATIMSYGFTCNDDDYFSSTTTGPILTFHTVNYDQAEAYIGNPSPGFGNCFVGTATGNTPPVVTVPTNYTIPKSTPFALTGSATDANGDALTYSWEGTNIGIVVPDANTLANTAQPPFFRTYAPSTSATRIYPLLSAILDGSNYAKGDKLPSVGIATTHRLTVRDNNAAGGGVQYGDVTVTVNGSIGPFVETTNLSASYIGGSSQAITWSVNGTSAATPNVKISLSIDGGFTFPTVLAASTPNDGTQAITLPNVATTTARIKVEGVDNIFFDISNNNFSITTAALPNLTINDITQAEGSSGTSAFTFTVNLSAPAPAGGVTFNVATANGTATAGSDYVALATTGSIAAGSTSTTVVVNVNGDVIFEGNETFMVNITNATNAVVTDAQGVGTITNDDPLPNLTITDVTQAEGNSGTSAFTFIVNLSAPAPAGGVTFNVATANNTAVAPGDYTAKSLTAQTIPAGSSTYSFTVLVNGDATAESTETFFVNVSNATNAVITDAQGVGTITTDDTDPCSTDVKPPVITPRNITINLDATGNATIQPADVIVSATDNCTLDSSSFTVTPNSFSCSGSVGSANHQAYVANTNTGNQAWTGELGMDFKVNRAGGILVKQLGAFDHQGNGITGTQSGGIRVAIFNKATQSIVAGLETVIVGNADQYAGKHRLKNITPVTLLPGDYVIVSKGYNTTELNGNVSFGGITPTPGDEGNGAISFTGSSRFGTPNTATFSYPQNGDGGPTNRYLAGTFVYDVAATADTGSANHQAYVASTTTGNQSWEGELGMEFRVNQGSGIIVKQLGTFDHQGNGITGTQSGGIRVAIFNKATQSIVAGLETVIIGNADSYTGNHRMKNVTPVTLMPGDYVIVSKGYNDNERNGNSGFAGVTPVPGDISNGAISYTGTGLYGNPNSATFSYPQNGDGGPANRYLAGTFVYDVPGTTGGGVGNNSVVISVKDAAGNIGYATATVTVTDVNGVCNQPSVSMAPKTVVNPTLVGAMRIEEIKMYPNPSTGAFTVSLSNLQGAEATLQVMYGNGKLIEQKRVPLSSKLPSQRVTFNLANQPTGVYFVKLISKQGIQTAKVVIQR